MRLGTLRTAGISSAFLHEVEVDFGVLGEGIIAVVGNNGVGKTTLLELSGPGTTHRRLPSYEETLANHLHPAAEQAFSELTFDLAGHSYRCKVQIDPAFSGKESKTEAWLWRDNEPEAIAGELPTGVDRAIGKIMPPLKLWLAANFACQSGAGDFFDETKAAKKSLFIKMLGLEQLERLALAAAGRAKEALTRLEAVRRDLGGAEEKVARAAQLDQRIFDSRAALDGVDERLTAARRALATANSQVTRLREELVRAELAAAEADRRKTQLAADRDVAAAAVTEAAARVQALETALADAATVRRAADRVQSIDLDDANLVAEIDAARARREPVDTEHAQLTTRLESLRDQYARIQAEHTAVKAAAARVTAAGDVDGKAVAARTERDRLASDVAAAEGLTSSLEQSEQNEREVAMRLAALLDKHAHLTTEHATASEAAERVAAAGDVDGKAATARAERDRLADELAAAKEHTAALEDAEQAEHESIATRTGLIARRDDLQARTPILQQIDATHPMCAVCPLVGNAREAVSTLQSIEQDLMVLPLVEGAPAAAALRAHREALTALHRTHGEAITAVGIAEAAAAALGADRATAARREAIAAELARNVEAGESLRAGYTEAARTGNLPPSDKPAAAALRIHREKLGALRRSHELAIAAVGTAEAAAAALGADRDAAARLEAIGVELAQSLEAGKAAKERHTALSGIRDEATRAIEALAARRATLGEERARLAAVAQRLAEILSAENQIVGARTAQQRATERVQSLAAEHAAIVVEDLSAQRTAVQEAAFSAQKVAESVAALEAERAPVAEALHRSIGERESLGDVVRSRDALRSREAELQITTTDWEHLERAFGRDGIQALELAEAAPAVTATANDLLSSCYGTRFQLRIDTIEPTKTKGKFKEIFDVVILDAQAKREGKKGCGGEMVIVGTALRLALAIYNGQRSGARMETLWLDEMTGALSTENATRYMQMLRRARAIGGFHQVIMISHLPQVWQQADAQIYVGSGRVSTTPFEPIHFAEAA